MTIFSTDKNFLAGWDDYCCGNIKPSSKINNENLWKKGWDAAKVYYLKEKEDEEALLELFE